MIIYKCDGCGCEIPIVKKEFFGSDIEVLDRGHIDCKEIDFRIINRFSNSMLCKNCAKLYSNQIDYELLKFKLAVLTERK